MLDLLDKIQANLRAKKKALSSINELPKGDPNILVTLSNTELLIEELRKFFKMDSSKYLPNTASVKINGYLQASNQLLEQLPDNDPLSADTISPIIKNMDEMYAYCLQLGLITFNFEAKEKVKTIENMRMWVNNVIDEVDKLKKKTTSINESLEILSSNNKEELKQILEQHRKSLADTKDTAEKQIKQIVSAIENESQQKKQDLERFLGEANSTLQKINELHTTICGTEQKTQQLLEQIAISMRATKDTEQQAQSAKVSIDQQLINAQKQNQQIDSQLQQAGTNAAEIKAKNTSVDEILAAVKQKQANIQEFYEKLESYRQDMTEIKKQSNEDYANLKNESDATIKNCRQQTDEILMQNINLQKEIKELLSQAVSAGLFGMFQERQKFLAKGREFWKWAVMISSLLVVGGIFIVAWLLSQKPDIIFFVRLAVMVPLGFLMFFTAAQYKKERQAEEEYAFKSAISFSLEPYRDLLVRMRENNELETSFVEKLMQDVFDNPVKRMYTVSSKNGSDEDVVSKLLSSLSELSDEKKQGIFDALKKAFC